MSTIILAVATAVVVVAVFWLADIPVTPVRLIRFARRQQLTITPANGDRVIVYLATTRRWRAAGVATGILGPIVLNGATVIGANVIAVFVGWFAGAVVAETRLAARPLGARRVASLQRRRPTAYLSRFAWSLVPATAGMSMAVAAGTVLFAYLAPADNAQAHPHWTAVLWPFVAIAVATIVRITQVRVVRRRQPHAEPDVIAADDAVRSRSLHVLAGGGAALVLCCVTAQLAALDVGIRHPAFGAVSAIQLLTFIAIPALAWPVGAGAWRVRPDAGGIARPA